MFLLGLPLRVDRIGDRTSQIVRAVLYLGRFGLYVIPAKYVTDFATIPRLLWPLIPSSGRHDPAAVVHDWLITHGLKRGAVEITSPQVDDEFRRALKVCRVGFITRWAMWAGVRWAAAFNPIRRPGWLGTLPALLGVSAALLAPVAAVVAALVVLL